MLADLVAGEHQVVHHLVIGQTDVAGHAVVALKLRRMAAQAVVHEQFGAALQRLLVVQIDIRLVQMHAATGREGQSRQQYQQKAQNYLSHLPVTLSGTGLVLSILV